MHIFYRAAMAVQSEEGWEPAFGTYGWLWITLVGIAGFMGYKLVRRRMDQAEELRRHEKIWGQRPDETEAQWKVRVQSQKDEELKRNQEWEAEARTRASQRIYRRSNRSAYNSRGDFDPPGGWGAMGPDNG
jgi:hypothetical protein